MPCCDWVLHRLLHAKRDAHDPTKSTECGWCLRWTSLETGTHCWLLISYPEKTHPSWTTLTAHLFDPVRMLSRFAWHEVQTKSCTNSSNILHKQPLANLIGLAWALHGPCMGLLENASFHSLLDWINFPYRAFQWDACNCRGNASRAMFHPAFGKANS
jgi:hypothetical protein